MSEHLEKLARVYGGPDEVWERLSASTEPLSPDSLLDVAGGYLKPGDSMLDVGCRDAAPLVRLLKSNEVTAVGVDPLDVHVQRAEANLVAAGLQGRATILKGVAEAIPYPDGPFDFIWCRDVLGSSIISPRLLQRCDGSSARRVTCCCIASSLPSVLSQGKPRRCTARWATSPPTTTAPAWNVC